MALSAGSRVPPFRVLDHDGVSVSHTDLVSGGPSVLYFYPADDTPGCTAQACEFRDRFEAFTDAGVSVFGASGDDPAKHRAFRERHRLPFRLLSDPDGELKKAFGVPDMLGLIAHRITFVIDRHGVIRKVFSSHLQPRRHVAEALALLEQLRAEA